nr:HNH endonuclease [Chloroflexota bacterium]
MPTGPTLDDALAALPAPTRPLKPLAPSFIPPVLWRSASGRALLSSASWKRTRLRILERDGYRCVYCDRAAERGLEVNHISGNSRDDRDENLETVCALCHRVLHAGRSAAVYG